MIYGLTAVGKHFGKPESPCVALRNLTMNIAEREQVALLGPSGSGKTTLFRLLNGSILPSCGQLLFRDSNVAAMTNAQFRGMRRKVGSVYQQHYLVSEMSALANTLSGALGRWSLAATLRNLLSPRGEEAERAEHCLEAVGLKDKRNFRCDQLSGGQQQRLAIARTLMQEPEVILADEPVASLDPALSDEILELLLRLANDGGQTLVISLHQVDLAKRYAKRIVALREAEVAFDVVAEDLDQELLEQLYRSDRPREAASTAPPSHEIRRGSACRIP